MIDKDQKALNKALEETFKISRMLYRTNNFEAHKKAVELIEKLRQLGAKTPED